MSEENIIQTEAYFLWEAAGKPQGLDKLFYFMAEKIRKEQTNKPRVIKGGDWTEFYSDAPNAFEFG